MGDCHVYMNHITALEEQIKRTPRPFPKLNIARKVDAIDQFEVKDFELSGYDPHPKISMDMAL